MNCPYTQPIHDRADGEPHIVGHWDVLYQVRNNEVFIDDVYLDRIDVQLFEDMHTLPLQLQTRDHAIEDTATRLRQLLDMELVREAAVEDWLKHAHLYEGEAA